MQEKPEYLKPIFENFPKELTTLNQWVVWKAVYDNSRGKWTKPLYNSLTGGYAKSNTPATWSSFEDARKAYQAGNYDGVGFVLTAADPIAGIDLDHILTQEGIDSKSQNIIDTLNTYTEKSPSGDGVRLFCIGKLPEGGRKKGDYECYESGRYLTVTGHRMNEKGIESRQSEIEIVHGIIFEKPQDTPPPVSVSHAATADLSDSELWDKMFKAANGDRIRDLYNGNYSGYKSQSEAVLALCGDLAFYTGRDALKMDSMFKESGLYRADKWDIKHHANGQTDGQHTIDLAISGNHKVYNPEYRKDNAKNMPKEVEIPENFEQTLISNTVSDIAYPFKSENLDIIKAIKATDTERYQRLRTNLKNIKGLSIVEFEKILNEKQKAKKTERSSFTPPTDQPYHIVQAGELYKAVEYGQEILNDKETLFQRGTYLIRIAEVKEGKKIKGLKRDDKANVIVNVTPAWLCNELDKKIVFMKFPKNEAEPFVINVPDTVGKRICENVGAWDFPYLAGVLETPTITPEGRIINKQGYDDDTCLYMNTSMDISPSADIQKAKAVIDSILSEYSFESEVDKAVAFSAILTAVVRRVIPTAPFFAIDAPTAGSGKTLLAECISLIATGKNPSLLNIPPFDDKEAEKRFDSVLLAGDSVVLIDNIEHTVKSERLCSIGTQEEVTARILGYSKTVKVRSLTLWLMTGNNLSFAGDICRRVLKCRINPRVENPEDRLFSKDLKSYVIKNRQEIVESVISILNGYIQSDLKPKLTPYGSYEDWSRFIRGAVIWLGMADPVIAKKSIQDDDSEKLKISALLDAIHAVYGDNPFTVNELIKTEYGDLREALLEFSKDGFTLDSRVIGNAIAKNKERVINGKSFVDAGKFRQKTKWIVKSDDTLTITAGTFDNTDTKRKVIVSDSYIPTPSFEVQKKVCTEKKNLVVGLRI